MLERVRRGGAGGVERETHDHPMTTWTWTTLTCLCMYSFVIPSWGTRKRLQGGGSCVRSVLLSGFGPAVSAAVRPLCAVGLSGSCQAVTLGPDSDGSPRLSGSAVRLSDTCCQTVRESAVSAVRLSGTVRRCPGFAVRLSDQGSATYLAYPRRSCGGAAMRRGGGRPTPRRRR